MCVSLSQVRFCNTHISIQLSKKTGKGLYILIVVCNNSYISKGGATPVIPIPSPNPLMHINTI